MVVVRAFRAKAEIDEVWVDPRDRREIALARALEEAAVTEWILTIEVGREHLAREPVQRIDDPQRRNVVVRVPTPLHLCCIKMAHKACEIPRPRRLQVVAMSCRRSGGGVAAIGHRRA